MLRDCELVSSLSGGIYRAGLRPRDSQVEDLVVVFTAADGEQVQEGVVTLNVFVPAIGPFENGVMVEDGARCEVVERMMQDQVEQMTCAASNYKFKLKNAVHTQWDDKLKQSFVVARLSFKLFNY